MKTFIIVGGNFQNTGAASMTLITVDSIRRKYPDCRIVMFAPTKDVNKDNSCFSFEIVHMSERAIRHAQFGGIDLQYIAEGIVRRILRKGNLFKEYKLLKELLLTCNGVFDINGYAISSQFRNQRTLKILDSVELFVANGIPYYFMPQSFGPFEFKDNKSLMIDRIRTTLPKAERIFTREHEGYLMLNELIGDEKLIESYDMVLQSNGIIKENVYKHVPEVKEIYIPTKGNVAIIPNMRNFEHGNREAILQLYKRAIDSIIGMNKNVYLLSHSAEDIEACRLIKEHFSSNGEVRMIEDRVNIWNFDMLIRQFDFTIASRFHSIVHSYRAGIPCIALGWATKYRELLQALGQDKFLFDVRYLSKDEGFFQVLKEMNENYVSEREVIKSRLETIQETSCFDMIDL